MWLMLMNNQQIGISKNQKSNMGLFSFLFGKRTERINLAEGHLGVYDINLVKEKWQDLETKLNLGRPSATREAVLEADKLLSYVLERVYPSGQNTGERLKAAKARFRGNHQEYNDLWYAHKIRNEMVHNVNFELPTSQAKDVLEKFKAGLRGLGGL